MSDLQSLLAVLTLVSVLAIVLSDQFPVRLLKQMSICRVAKSLKDGVAGCPYEYLREIYGRHHWVPFVTKLEPNLKNNDPEKYTMVLEIMDCMHLCLILVDDVSVCFLRY